MSEKPINVLIVDDSVTYQGIVSNVLSEAPGIEVVGRALDGKSALDKIARLKPDVVTLDVEMPGMDGLEVLRQLKLAHNDVGVIMLSAVTSKDAKSTIVALGRGAFDFVVKPAEGTFAENIQRLREILCPKIEALARLRRADSKTTTKIPHAIPTTTDDRESADVIRRMNRAVAPFSSSPCVVALGISTGGPQTLARVLPRLPNDLPVPILLVQHMPTVFTKSLAEDLDRRCAIKVYEGADYQAVEPGCVYIAPGSKQMRVAKQGDQTILRITTDPPENSCRPSVDYLFRSVVDIYDRNVLGVIMTGMGNDGTLGCRLLKQRGATILAQNEDSCVVYGMPRGPIEEGLADFIDSPEAIADEIIRRVRRGLTTCT